MAPLDLLIRNGSVIDGTGAPARRADVGIRGGRIEAIGDLGAATAAESIDATGHVVSPGFIDSHTHGDLAWRLPDEHLDVKTAELRQGVTTEITGNCGFSPFPARGPHAADVERMSGTIGAGVGSWPDLAAYRAAATGLATNVAPMVGHGALRATVLGFADRPPDAAELDEMVRLAVEALEAGAVGFSTGLVYAPGRFAATQELIAIARTLARHGRPYVSHMRGEDATLMDSIREALRIGREAGVPVHISHLKAASRANWGRTEDALAAIDGARAQGQDVSCDVYPYTAASTLLGSTLPAWVLVGGIDAMVARLRDRASRDRIRHDWQERPPLAGWDAIFIAGCAGRPELEGKGVAALAAARGADPVDLVLDLIAEQAGRVTMVIHLMHEDDVERVIAHPASMIGSDAIPAPGKPHPRLAGTFVRVLGHYVRERELLDLPTAVRKMTAMPAARFGLRDRGVLAPGKIADVVVFDPATVIDRATYEQPLLTPVGVRAVIVNGRVAVRDGETTGLRAGVMLGD